VDRNGQAQVAPPAVDVNAAVATDLEEIEEIIVRGRSFGELRMAQRDQPCTCEVGGRLSGSISTTERLPLRM